MDTLETIIIAIVEGVTEFLPVSSTGHMIITQNLLGVESTEFVKAFTFIIQFGAILSVVVLYWKRFFRLNHTPAPEGASALGKFLHKYDFYWKLFVAFIPAAVLGLLFNDMIDAMLESVTVVAVTLILGGIFMLFCDRIFNKGDEKTALTENLKNDEDFSKKIVAVEERIKKDYRAERLTDENIELLYGKTLKGSVSRFEKFNDCPFSYFVQYGLKAKERKIS